MEGFRLSSLFSGLASVLLAVVPDVAKVLHLVNLWTEPLLKVASLVSVLIIIFLNLKKLRSHAASSS